MSCTEIENKMLAFVERSLPVAEMQKIEAHLPSCESCSKALAETRSLLNAMEKVEQKEPSASLHQGFQEMLEKEKQLQKTVRTLREPSFNWKTAFQIAASLLLLIAGYSIGRYSNAQATSEQISSLREESELLKQNVMLALIDNRSASKRIQAVNYTEEISAPDSRTLEALIDRMQYDGNINVRLAAAEALSRFSENKQVKDAFIESLTIEKDPNIQIAIIQFLVKAQDQRARVPMQQLLKQTETPNYVKDQVNAGLSNLM